MNTNYPKIMKKLFPLLILTIFFDLSMYGQTVPTSQQDTVTEKSMDKKQQKRVSDFKVYAGISTSKILLSDSPYESTYSTGYLLGFSYRQGRFGYWEVGLNYNNSVVSLEGVNILEDNISIRQFEFPLTAGINLLSPTRRVLGLRLFGGIVPAYVAGVNDNPFDLEKDDFNRFQFSGRIGVGMDILFFFIEGGYQYGFLDLLEDQDTKLSQIDLRLGFRF